MAFGLFCGADTRCPPAAALATRMRLYSGRWVCCDCGMCTLGPFRELAVKSVGKPDAGNPHVGLMSGEGKPPAATRSRSSALPRLYSCAPIHLDAVGTTIGDRPRDSTVRARLRIRLPPWMCGDKRSRG